MPIDNIAAYWSRIQQSTQELYHNAKSSVARLNSEYFDINHFRRPDFLRFSCYILGQRKRFEKSLYPRVSSRPVSIESHEMLETTTVIYVCWYTGPQPDCTHCVVMIPVAQVVAREFFEMVESVRNYIDQMDRPHT